MGKDAVPRHGVLPLTGPQINSLGIHFWITHSAVTQISNNILTFTTSLPQSSQITLFDFPYPRPKIQHRQI
jgi:hypothetical protein